MDWNLAQGIDADTPKKSIGIMQANGTVKTVSYNVYDAADGIIVLGKYQYIRARTLHMNNITVDNQYLGLTCRCKLLTSIKGKEPDYIKELFPVDSDQSISKEYLCNAVGINHSIALKGNFDLNSVVLTFALGGDR
jgi:hypothetical protein